MDILSNYSRLFKKLESKTCSIPRKDKMLWKAGKRALQVGEHENSKMQKSSISDEVGYVSQIPCRYGKNLD
jgi:hypothetical protein